MPCDADDLAALLLDDSTHSIRHLRFTHLTEEIIAPMSRRLLAVIFSLVCLAAAQEKSEPSEATVREHYTKYEYRIPMRDGVHLFTSVYVPKDSTQTYPFLIVRTPYSVGPYGADNYPKGLGPSPEFEKAGYIFVFQDVRGRYMSEGTFLEMTPHIDNKKSQQGRGRQQRYFTTPSVGC